MSKHIASSSSLWAALLLTATTLAVPMAQAVDRVKTAEAQTEQAKKLAEAQREQAKKLAEAQKEQAKKHQDNGGDQGGGGQGGGGQGGGTTASLLPPETASYTFKPGLNVEMVREACLECHSADYVTSQPPQSYASWLATVNKMISTFKMDALTTSERESILLYLTTNYGK